MTMKPTNLAFQAPNPDQIKAIILTEDDIDACFTLQQAVREKLIAAGTPHYLKPLTKEQFAGHFQTGGAVLGIKNEQGQLVAMARLTFPNEGNIDSLSQDFGGVDLSGTALIGGIARAWSEKGKNHSLTLLEAAKAVAAEYGFEALVGKVAKTNIVSHNQFLKAQFGLAAMGVDSKCDCLPTPYEFSCFKWPTPAIAIV